VDPRASSGHQRFSSLIILHPISLHTYRPQCTYYRDVFWFAICNDEDTEASYDDNGLGAGSTSCVALVYLEPVYNVEIYGNEQYEKF